MENHWLDKTEYPFTSKFFSINEQKLHYIDEGKGDTILFIHGTPSWSFDFRNVIKKLKHKFRCIAIDHIGFGLSSKPKEYDYTTQNHSKTLEKFIMEKNLENITLVVHDFGGPIGLNFAIQYPNKIKNLIIMNSWLWSSENDPYYKKLKRILKSPLLPFLYRYFNFSPKYILPNSFGDIKLSKHLLKQYTKPFANSTQRSGTIAFAKSLLYDQNFFEELWNQKHLIASKPTLLIWGMKDPIIKPYYLDKFQSGFSNSKTVKLDSCGHFPQEEEPEIVAKSILEFIS